MYVYHWKSSGGINSNESNLQKICHSWNLSGSFPKLPLSLFPRVDHYQEFGANHYCFWYAQPLHTEESPKNICLVWSVCDIYRNEALVYTFSCVLLSWLNVAFLWIIRGDGFHQDSFILLTACNCVIQISHNLSIFFSHLHSFIYFFYK